VGRSKAIGRLAADNAGGAGRRVWRYRTVAPVVDTCADAAQGEVLVRVGAAGVGPWDALVREGRSGLALALPVTLGADLSGVVVEVGDGAEDLAPGDAIFGVMNDRFVGAYAEFALADASRLARKPVGLGFIEAGGMPVVAVTARSMLFDYGELQSGQRVLVHGSAGAVGNLVVQLAHAAGAEVIATCRARDVAFVTKMGADEVIDIEARDFVLGAKPVNLVIDTVGGETQRRSFDVIAPGAGWFPQGKGSEDGAQGESSPITRSAKRSGVVTTATRRLRRLAAVTTCPAGRLREGSICRLRF
jgi:NADPH:quinone reductase-like Zn-dependent oxidoreductase